MCEIGNYRSFAYKLLGKFVAVDQNIGDQSPPAPQTYASKSRQTNMCVSFKGCKVLDQHRCGHTLRISVIIIKFVKIHEFNQFFKTR